MTNEHEDADREGLGEGLPRRDLWLMPLLSFLTVFVSVFSAEVAARHWFSYGSVGSCVVSDQVIGFRFRPNCTAREKVSEGPWFTNDFNNCGYRTKESCGKIPPEHIRIALLGSSLSFGAGVRYEDTFAQQTAMQLTQVLGRPVEVQNLGRPNTSLISTFHQIDEALALKPNLLVMAISPYDLERIDPDDLPNRYKPITPQQFAMAQVSRASGWSRLKGLVGQSRLAFAAQHYYYQDTSNFAHMYLHYGDRADYLRQPFTPAWQNRLEAFSVIMRETKAKCAAASVPLVLVEVPTLAQASLLQMKELPTGVNPYALNARLKEITSSNGLEFIDTLNSFESGPEINQVFYVVDGHINARGNALVADTIVKQLVEHLRPALLKVGTTQSTSRPERNE